MSVSTGKGHAEVRPGMRSPVAREAGPAPSGHRMLGLQRGAGNQAVQSLLMPRRSPSRSASAGLPAVVTSAMEGGGQSLDPAIRGQMEAQLGHDFGDVRVHTDSRAAESARALHANAYAVDNHLFFDAGRYQPKSAAGERLLAHELAHVAQRERVGGNDRAAAEAEADVAAREISGGRSYRVRAGAPAGAILKEPKQGLPPLPAIPAQVTHDGSTDVLKVLGFELARISTGTSEKLAQKSDVSVSWERLPSGTEYSRKGNSVSLRLVVSVDYENTAVTCAANDAGRSAVEDKLPSAEIRLRITAKPPKPAAKKAALPSLLPRITVPGFDPRESIRDQKERIKQELEMPIDSKRSGELIQKLEILRMLEPDDPPAQPDMPRSPFILKLDASGDAPLSEDDRLRLDPKSALGVSFNIDGRSIPMEAPPQSELAIEIRNLYHDLQAIKDEAERTWTDQKNAPNLFGGIEPFESLKDSVVKAGNEGLAILDRGGPKSLEEAQRKLKVARAWLDVIHRAWAYYRGKQEQGAADAITGIKVTAAVAIAVVTLGYGVAAAGTIAELGTAGAAEQGVTSVPWWFSGASAVVPDAAEKIGRAAAGEKVDWANFAEEAAVSFLMGAVGGKLLGAVAENPLAKNLPTRVIASALTNATVVAALDSAARSFIDDMRNTEITWDAFANGFWKRISDPQARIIDLIIGAAAGMMHGGSPQESAPPPSNEPASGSQAVPKPLPAKAPTPDPVTPNGPEAAPLPDTPSGKLVPIAKHPAYRPPRGGPAVEAKASPEIGGSNAESGSTADPAASSSDAPSKNLRSLADHPKYQAHGELAPPQEVELETEVMAQEEATGTRGPVGVARQPRLKAVKDTGGNGGSRSTPAPKGRSTTTRGGTRAGTRGGGPKPPGPPPPARAVVVEDAPTGGAANDNAGSDVSSDVADIFAEAQGNAPPRAAAKGHGMRSRGGRAERPQKVLTHPEALRADLEAKGIPVPDGHDAHHIVPTSGGGAAGDRARAVIAREGIGPDSEANGVPLPRSSMDPNTVPEGLTRHQTVHTDVYYEALADALEKAPPGTVKDLLRSIRILIVEGKFPH